MHTSSYVPAGGGCASMEVHGAQGMAERERKWLTGDEIDDKIDSALDKRFEAFEKRIEPTLDALRDGAQSSLLTNVLLAGDGRFVQKGFIQETRDRFQQIEEKQADMHAENLKLQNTMIERQSFIMRCVEWLTHKDEDGERRWHRLVIAGGAVGSGVTYAVAHLPAWLSAARRVFGK